MVRVYRYRLYPTRGQDAALRETLYRLRELYNAALQERRDAYRQRRATLTCYDQQKSLREVREVRPEYAGIHVHVLQDALTRLDRAYRAFFRRIRAGETPGFPRFKGRDRYQSFTFKEAGNGAKLVNGRLRIHGIGHVKLKMHRPYAGTLKQISVSLDSDGHWYAALVCVDAPAEPLFPTGVGIGIDVGITTFAALSNGQLVANPRPLLSAQTAVAAAQRVVSRRKRGSRRRSKAVRLLAKQHARVRNTRKDFHHKTALDIVRRFDHIAIEDLNVKGLARSMLAGFVHDAGWAQFATILSNKAESAGRTMVRVDPRGTSQQCSECGAEVRKTLSVRVHECPHCGYSADRDTNAACNIKRRGQRLREGVNDVVTPQVPRSRSLGR